MTNKTLPSAITSYDVLKCFALVTMIIDHVGGYIFPDEEWLRAIGRLSFPIWLFLIGYARSRDLSKPLMISAIALIALDGVLGAAIFPLNILVTIILVRLSMDWFMPKTLTSHMLLWSALIVSLVCTIPTQMFLEYGSSAFAFALFGYLVRHNPTFFSVKQGRGFLIVLWLCYIVLQNLIFSFTKPEFLVMAAGVFVCMIWLLSFTLKTYPSLKLGGLSSVIKLGGRRTLEIYVLHLFIFKCLAVYLGLKTWVLFQPSFF